MATEIESNGITILPVRTASTVTSMGGYVCILYLLNLTVKEFQYLWDCTHDHEDY